MGSEAARTDQGETVGDAVRDGGASSDRGGRDAGMPGTGGPAGASGNSGHPSAAKAPTAAPNDPAGPGESSKTGAQDFDRANDPGPTS